MLTKNLITPNKSKTYTFINRDYGELSKYLYNKTGLQLIKMNDSYKLQTKSDKPTQITKNDTPLTYQLYILITASLIARRLNEEFTQQELADEILPNFEDIETADSTFKGIIRYMINEKYLNIRTETDENDDEIKILKKLAQPVIYTGELKSHKLSNIAKITNYLLTHPTMNKLEQSIETLKKAPFMTTSEFEKQTKTKAPKYQHYLTDGLSVLEMMIDNSNEVVYEEQLDLTKCLKYIK